MELIKPQKGTNYNIENDIQNLTSIEQEFEQIDNKITNDITSSIDELKDKVDNDITTAITELDNKVDTEIVTAIDNLETKVNTEISESITALDNKVTTSLQEQAESLKKEISDQIAKVVANSPEDFDTLKEISDWISGHSSDAAAMNSAILSKADKDLSNVTGVLPIANGGTGETTGTNACNSLLKSLQTGADTPIDTDTFISQYAGGSASEATSPDKNNYYKRPVSALWEYIKGKISSVLGLTATQYNGNAKTATQATGATPFNAAQQTVTVGTVTRAVAQNVVKSGNGYISRIALGLTNKTSQFSDGIISLGSNDAGTSWEDFTLKKGTGGEVITSATINNQTVNNAYNAYRGMVHTCTTAPGTKAKTVSVTGFTLATGACVRVVFTQGNETSRPTLNVNNTGAKEIKIISFKNGYYTESSLDGTNGFYTWKPFISLDLYYNGSCWIVLDNPVVYDNTGYPTSPQYRICIDGYKEIRGTYYYGYISDGRDINIKVPLPLLLVDSDHCHVSLTARQAQENYPTSGEEMSCYLDEAYLKIHFYNRNSSDDMQGVSFEYMIFGY